MPIDGCTHTFQHLANVILPAHMERMRQAMLAPIPMEKFATKNDAACRKLLDVQSDFSGCYVLIDERPIYVGISRTIIKRLSNHVTGRDHNQCTLAYQMAKHKRPHKLTRKVAMADPAFREEFDNAKEMIRQLHVATIRIDCPVELYVFEAYCSLELHTDQWNTFRTH